MRGLLYAGTNSGYPTLTLGGSGLCHSAFLMKHWARSNLVSCPSAPTPSFFSMLRYLRIFALSRRTSQAGLWTTFGLQNFRSFETSVAISCAGGTAQPPPSQLSNHSLKIGSVCLHRCQNLHSLLWLFLMWDQSQSCQCGQPLQKKHARCLSSVRFFFVVR